ncbi:hypothetical protein EL75_4033 [Escherichia coli]|nr:hypothetical protein EL75_4033 [Escherichia coli]KGM76986.1 hypothetical protein EL80_4127 [Escherichia coli]KGM79537.1 hypothetical protein EL79_4211 [Escherichia coli]
MAIINSFQVAKNLRAVKFSGHQGKLMLVTVAWLKAE